MPNQSLLKPQVSQGQKLGQRLSSRQAQFIRLLQLPQLELREEIAKQMADNPLLENDDDENVVYQNEVSRENELENNNFDDSQASKNIDDADSKTQIDSNLDSGDSFNFENETADLTDKADKTDRSWEDTSTHTYTDIISHAGDEFGNLEYPTKISNNDFENNFNQDNTYIKSNNLYEDLLIEAKSKAIDNTQSALVEIIIANLDEKGFLSEKLEDIHALINHKQSVNIKLTQFAKALELIQCLEPAGIAARDLRECLLLQSERLPNSKLREDCIKILSSKILYNLLIQKRTRKILDKLFWEKERFADVLTTLAIFSNNPADLIADNSSWEYKQDYIVADVLVRKIKHQWVAISADNFTKIRISPIYAEIINGYRKKTKRKKASKNNKANENDDIATLANKLTEANLLIKDLKNRAQTILAIANYIVDYQRNFFELGEIAIKPLLQKEIAEKFSLHSSSISRIISGKYMDTPQGMLAFSYFTVRGKISSDYGGEYSSTSVIAMMREFIEKEDTQKPLRDYEISKLLADNGVKASTRIISKYRNENNILSWFKRKK